VEGTEEKSIDMYCVQGICPMMEQSRRNCREEGVGGLTFQ
jgi:hypothetical protein